MQKYDFVFKTSWALFKAKTLPFLLNLELSLGFQKQDQFLCTCEKVDIELKRLVNEGTLEPVQFAEWASPIVAVLKSDYKTVRIC